MAFSLTWLPQVLKDAGLKVATVDGWLERGRGDVGRTLGVICHHTVGRREGNMPSLDLLIKGRPDLPGPLSQLGLGRDGTYYVIAAGRCNHAGAGEWNGVKAGNTHFIGIEAEHTGQPTDPWPAVQTDAYERGVAAMLKHLGLAATACAGHKEWAPKRKTDPTFDMALFRTKVAAILAGTAPAPVLIPAVEPPAPGGAGRGTLRRGATGPLVTELQKRLGITADGDFGAHTEAAVRAFQRTRNMVPDGIFGPKSWAALDATPAGNTAAAASTNAGEENTAVTPWPNTLASRMVAAYIDSEFHVSPSALMLSNPPMGAMPFFNNAASPDIRLAELGLVTGRMLGHFEGLLIPFEPERDRAIAHAQLVSAMVDEKSPSAGMSIAINDNFRFLDEV